MNIVKLYEHCGVTVSEQYIVIKLRLYQKYHITVHRL